MKALALILMALFGGSSPKEAAAGDERATQQQRTLSVPWPMVCNFIVRVIDGPADTAIVASKRDCPN